MHPEGPYICHSYRGAHASEWLRNPDPREYRGWLQSGVIRLIALAPELPGALDLIRAGVDRGVRFSAGHTQATMEEIRAAVAAGLNQAVHLATVTPAAALGLLGIMGEIRPGLRADLLIADEEMNVKAVMTGGKFAYRSPDLS